jgi:Fe-S cluster assembly ATP-binding protein
MRLCGPDMGVLVITHYPRILEHLHPDRVHVLHDGRVVTSGGPDLARQIEREGYEPILGTAVAATA